MPGTRHVWENECVICGETFRYRWKERPDGRQPGRRRTCGTACSRVLADRLNRQRG